MTIQYFQPEIWAAQLLVSLKKALVYAQPQVANRDYEGEIANAGDTVRITSVSRPTIGTYTKGSTTIVPEQLTDAQRSLLIDQSKYFAFEIDDIDKAQVLKAGELMSEAATEASYGLGDLADQFVAGLYTGAQSANALGTVAVTTGDLAYSTLVNLKTKLDEANVATANRYAVIPPWYHSLLLVNTNFINAEKAADQGAALRNGFIGRAAGFDLLMSNNAPLVTGDDYAVMAGVPGAITYADQIVQVEAYRPQDSFSDALKGLHVYGAKLVRPDAIATVVASKT